MVPFPPLKVAPQRIQGGRPTSFTLQSDAISRISRKAKSANCEKKRHLRAGVSAAPGTPGDNAVDGVVGPMTSGELLARSAPTRQPTDSEQAATSDGRRATDAARAVQPIALPKDGGPRRDEPDELADFVANPLAVGAVALMSLAVVVLTSMLAPRLLPAVAPARRRKLAYPRARIRSALFSSGHLFAGKPRGRALGYVSVAQSTLLDSASVLAQICAIHEACGAERLSLVEVVHDIDRSPAKPLERPGFQYALDRIAAGDATHLVAAKQTALWRSSAEFSEVMRELSRRGGLIYSVNGEPKMAPWPGGRSAPSLQSSPVRRLIFDQPASADAAGATRTMIGSMTPDLSGSERYDLMLAATEVVNNAVLHAGQRGEGDIRVELAVSEARVRFAVRDERVGLRRPAVPPKGRPADRWAGPLPRRRDRRSVGRGARAHNGLVGGGAPLTAAFA